MACCYSKNLSTLSIVLTAIVLAVSVSCNGQTSTSTQQDDSAARRDTSIASTQESGASEDNGQSRASDSENSDAMPSSSDATSSSLEATATSDDPSGSDDSSNSDATSDTSSASDSESESGSDSDDTSTSDETAAASTDVSALYEHLIELSKVRPASREEANKLRSDLKATATKILQTEKDQSSTAYREANFAYLSMTAYDSLNASANEQRAAVNEIASLLKSADIGTRELRLAMDISQYLEQINREIAAEANEAFAASLKDKNEAPFPQVVESFAGSARRLQLVGKPMKLEGKTVDGTPFDWESYRGKVVLVDFWATWCGSCMQELPNVVRNHQRYHDQGFEVVGISIDQDREALMNFLDKEQLPWKTLHEPGGNHPTAQYYGVTAIPTTILVGRDGKVVSLSARGPELGRLLAKLIDENEPLN